MHPALLRAAEGGHGRVRRHGPGHSHSSPRGRQLQPGAARRSPCSCRHSSCLPSPVPAAGLSPLPPAPASSRSRRLSRGSPPCRSPRFGRGAGARCAVELSQLRGRPLPESRHPHTPSPQPGTRSQPGSALRVSAPGTKGAVLEFSWCLSHGLASERSASGGAVVPCHELLMSAHRTPCVCRDPRPAPCQGEVSAMWHVVQLVTATLCRAELAVVVFLGKQCVV